MRSAIVTPNLSQSLRNPAFRQAREGESKRWINSIDLWGPGMKRTMVLSIAVLLATWGGWGTAQFRHEPPAPGDRHRGIHTDHVHLYGLRHRCRPHEPAGHGHLRADSGGRLLRGLAGHVFGHGDPHHQSVAGRRRLRISAPALRLFVKIAAPITEKRWRGIQIPCKKDPMTVSRQNADKRPLQPIKRLLWHVLVDGGFISDHDLERALQEQNLSNEMLGEVLIRMGVLAPGDLSAALYAQGELASSEDALRSAAGPRQLLGELLLTAKRISSEHLDLALEEQWRTGES